MNTPMAALGLPFPLQGGDSCGQAKPDLQRLLE